MDIAAALRAAATIARPAYAEVIFIMVALNITPPLVRQRFLRVMKRSSVTEPKQQPAIIIMPTEPANLRRAHQYHAPGIFYP